MTGSATGTGLPAELSLADRVAVVTGGASGIGLGTARVLAEAGAAVVVADVSADGVRRAVAEIEAAGGRAAGRVVDVRDRSAVDALGDHVVATAGRLDVWVNAAGVLRRSSLLDTTEDELHDVFAVNYFGTYWGVQTAGRAMAAAGGGSIVNVASTGGEKPGPTLSGYGSSKAAVIHLTRIAALELGPSGVRVNAVAPGWIVTPMTQYHWTREDGTTDEALRDETVRHMTAGAPLDVVGEPRDVALSILFLATPASRFTTGQVMRPNGGVHLA